MGNTYSMVSVYKDVFQVLAFHFLSYMYTLTLCSCVCIHTVKDSTCISLGLPLGNYTPASCKARTIIHLVDVSVATELVDCLLVN